ncbi:MAG TPA: nucleoside hydrolase [Chloroflexota bacterium]|jgi:purine nucleosidase
MPTRVVLDTDIGTDVDDALALAVILGSPELRLDGVTCVYGDVQLRARMVLKLLRLRGRDDVPVCAGVEPPLLGRRPVYWAGHEGEGLLDAADRALRPRDEHAVDFLVRHVMAHPGEIHLLAIGPLTNVALAFRREPRLPGSLRHLTVMGGAARGLDDLGLPYAEHNIKCDPEAAHVVLSAGAPTTLVPLDVTTKVLVRERDLDRIRAGGTAFHAAIADQIARYPRFKQTGGTPLHDPLAAATVVRSDLVGLSDLRVEVETEGHHAAGMTLMRRPTAEAPATARVALTVDAPAAEEFVVGRLAG